MKNFKLLALAAAAMIVGLTSCNKETENTDVEGTKNVTILLDNSNKSNRAIDGAAGGLATTFSTGQLIFARNSGVITRVYTIVSTATDLTNFKVNISDLTAGYGVTFAGVNGDKVCVLGNKTISTIVVGANIDSQLALAANKLDRTDLKNGSFATAVLYGSAAIVPVATTPNPNNGSTSDHYANITIAPVAARIEVSKLTEISSTQDYTYELEGIYINNYYQNLNINGASTDKQTWMANADLSDTNYPNKSVTEMYGTYHDFIHNTTAGKTNSPTAGNVWAYNVYPAKNVGATDDNIPHILVHMKNLKKGTELIYADYYLTIATYGTNKEFKAGNVYTIADIRFDASKNGGPIIEEKLINCDVKVSVATWIPNVINPDVN